MSEPQRETLPCRLDPHPRLQPSQFKILGTSYNSPGFLVQVTEGCVRSMMRRRHHLAIELRSLFTSTVSSRILNYSYTRRVNLPVSILS
ncbi:hypothetical protein CC2G_014831 [Coprinopsis cinerea AmutBmut pab1-1]|nr:hypothetical protein CC2G_014831 [Coprinopsis cinerea AmutBmut pab1-1]